MPQLFQQIGPISIPPETSLQLRSQQALSGVNEDSSALETGAEPQSFIGQSNL